MSLVVPLYGGLSDFGYYFADVSIGSPPQRMSAIIDTGSEGLSVTCSTCSDCGQKHMDPFYNPAVSSTFSDELNCFAYHQSLRSPTQCLYQKKYLEGSSLIGRYASDLVSVGESFEAKRIRFGCIESETKLFLNQKANGILGLSPSEKTLLFSDNNDDTSIIGFSVCLSKNGGELEFFHHEKEVKSNHNVQLKYTDKHYIVSPSSVWLDTDEVAERDQVSDLLGNQVLFDTGSTVTYINDVFYKKIIERISNNIGTRAEMDYIVSRDPTMCWRSSQSIEEFVVSYLPRIVFKFQTIDGGEVMLTFSDYAFRESDNRYCLRIASNGSLKRTDLGASFMIGKKFVFTVKLGTIGLVDNAQCKEKLIEERHAVEPIEGQLTATLITSKGNEKFDLFSIFILAVILSALPLVWLVRKSVYRPLQQNEIEFEIGEGSPSSQLE